MDGPRPGTVQNGGDEIQEGKDGPEEEEEQGQEEESDGLVGWPTEEQEELKEEIQFPNLP